MHMNFVNGHVHVENKTQGGGQNKPDIRPHTHNLVHD